MRGQAKDPTWGGGKCVTLLQSKAAKMELLGHLISTKSVPTSKCETRTFCLVSNNCGPHYSTPLPPTTGEGLSLNSTDQNKNEMRDQFNSTDTIKLDNLISAAA
jgi:hypothetical protein